MCNFILFFCSRYVCLSCALTLLQHAQFNFAVLKIPTNFMLGEKQCLSNQNITLNQTTQFTINSGETVQFYFNVTSPPPSSYYIITLQTAISNNISIYISLSNPCQSNYDYTFSSNGKLKTQFSLSSNFSGLTALNPGASTNFYLTINLGMFISCNID